MGKLLTKNGKLLVRQGKVQVGDTPCGCCGGGRQCVLTFKGRPNTVYFNNFAPNGDDGFPRTTTEDGWEIHKINTLIIEDKNPPGDAIKSFWGWTCIKYASLWRFRVSGCYGCLTTWINYNVDSDIPPAEGWIQERLINGLVDPDNEPYQNADGTLFGGNIEMAIAYMPWEWEAVRKITWRPSDSVYTDSNGNVQNQDYVDQYYNYPFTYTSDRWTIAPKDYFPLKNQWFKNYRGSYWLYIQTGDIDLSDYDNFLLRKPSTFDPAVLNAKESTAKPSLPSGWNSTCGKFYDAIWGDLNGNGYKWNVSGSAVCDYYSDYQTGTEDWVDPLDDGTGWVKGDIGGSCDIRNNWYGWADCSVDQNNLPACSKPPPSDWKEKYLILRDCLQNSASYVLRYWPGALGQGSVLAVSSVDGNNNCFTVGELTETPPINPVEIPPYSVVPNCDYCKCNHNAPESLTLDLTGLACTVWALEPNYDENWNVINYTEKTHVFQGFTEILCTNADEIIYGNYQNASGYVEVTIQYVGYPKCWQLTINFYSLDWTFTGLCQYKRSAVTGNWQDWTPVSQCDVVYHKLWDCNTNQDSGLVIGDNKSGGVLSGKTIVYNGECYRIGNEQLQEGNCIPSAEYTIAEDCGYCDRKRFATCADHPDLTRYTVKQSDVAGGVFWHQGECYQAESPVYLVSKDYGTDLDGTLLDWFDDCLNCKCDFTMPSLLTLDLSGLDSAFGEVEAENGSWSDGQGASVTFTPNTGGDGPPDCWHLDITLPTGTWSGKRGRGAAGVYTRSSGTIMHASLTAALAAP